MSDYITIRLTFYSNYILFISNYILFISNYIRFIFNYIHLISNCVLSGIYVPHQQAIDVLFQRRNSFWPCLGL